MTTQAPQKNGTGSAIQRSGNDKMASLKTLFERAKPNLAAMLPKHLPAEKVVKLVLSAASRTPELLECTPQSILLAAMQSAALGLEPNTPLQQAYLVPYRNKKQGGRKEAQFIPGYRGLITLAVQSGEIKSVQARVVHEKDTFAVRYGLDETIVHEPYLDGDAGKMIAVYSVAKFTNGAATFEVMTKAQVDAVMKASQTRGEFGPWRDHYEEMAKKTVIRRHAKVMPMSTEKHGFTAALGHQARAEDGAEPDYSDVIEALPSDDVAGALGVGEDGAPVDADRGGDPLADRLADKAKADS